MIVMKNSKHVRRKCFVPGGVFASTFHLFERLLTFMANVSFTFELFLGAERECNLDTYKSAAKANREFFEPGYGKNATIA